MQISRIAVAVIVLGFVVIASDRAAAQYQPPSEKLVITTDHATSWADGSATVVLADSPVVIELDNATLSAKQAVIWLTPAPGAAIDQQQAQIALIGDAKLEQPQQQLTRTGDRLFVTADVRSIVRLVVEQRTSDDLSNTELYREANRLRPISPARTPDGEILQRPWNEQPTIPAPTTSPAPRPREPVRFTSRHVETTQTADGKVAFVLSGGAYITQRRANGDLLELQADRAVMFTQLRNLREAGEGRQLEAAEDAVEASYLEGDVRIALSPASSRRAEQRLEAQRVYYEFTTDRAVLTQAVIHTTQPESQLPITVRAATIRQLSNGEYRADKVELSTSQLKTPTYSLRADRAYVRQVETGDVRYGQQTNFVAHDATMNLFGVPFFWLPVMSGTMTERGTALRSLYAESSNRFGFGMRSEWGLFETLGVLPPDDLDIGYRVDYFVDRGPGIGTDISYKGGYITETTKEPWDFTGKLTGYLINDHGDDRFGGDRRVVVPDDNIRGHILWEHQHFFPDDWQVQARVGYASDPTFLEEFFEREFNTGLPHDLSLYVKRQRDTEALTLLFEYPTNDFTTTANELQEQVQVERLPEIAYRRIGDSIVRDQFTFFSDNRVGLLHFKENGPSLAEQGFRAGQSPGIPSYGQTGTDDDTNLRGDFRQEIDYPFSAGQFKLVPYVVGRYTGYTDTPDNGGRDRVLVGTGVRVNTAFWRVDDTAKSDLFDIHRMRHVIEPELNLFTSAQTNDQSDFFIYDEAVDSINDITAVQLALHQRWQTKRGGAGRFRSVDFFTLNVEGNFFFNQPNDTILNPTGFRGLFYPSMPEASIPRNSVNADALWRVSDTTVVLADEEYNIDDQELATASIGVAVQREPRMSYFAGTRYIGQINSTIATIAATYELSQKYTVAFTQSFNLAERRNQDSNVTIIRRFDRLFVTLTLYYDAVNDESGFRFGIIPEGLGKGLSSSALEQVFGP